MVNDDHVDLLARKLHQWYLDATKRLSTGSFNPDAQTGYDDMTKEQQSIDRYIAEQLLNSSFCRDLFV